MNLLYVIYTYNRPKILQDCLYTLFNNNNIKPSRVLVIDDGSELSLKAQMFSIFMDQQKIKIPVDFLSFSNNIGYGTVSEFGIRMADIYNPDYVFFIESDYVFRNNGLDEVIEIFEKSDIGNNSVAFSGYDNPDFYCIDKINNFFSTMTEEIGEDNLNRNIMYKPFNYLLSSGKEIKLEFVSNSCGTMYFNWKVWKNIKSIFSEEIEIWINKTTEKYKKNRCLNDGYMSYGIANLWTKWAKYCSINTHRYGPILNIKPSVADHINGAGINGSIVEEGVTFVSSPTYHHAQI